MAKFKFYQDKEIKTWVRDYFTVEADNLEDAIAYIENMDCPFEDDEYRKGTQIEFDYRDMDWTMENAIDLFDCDVPSRYSIFSCDLDERGDDSEVLRK